MPTFSLAVRSFIVFGLLLSCVPAALRGQGFQPSQGVWVCEDQPYDSHTTYLSDQFISGQSEVADSVIKSWQDFLLEKYNVNAQRMCQYQMAANTSGGQYLNTDYKARIELAHKFGNTLVFTHWRPDFSTAPDFIWYCGITTQDGITKLSAFFRTNLTPDIVETAWSSYVGINLPGQSQCNATLKTLQQLDLDRKQSLAQFKHLGMTKKIDLTNWTPENSTPLTVATQSGADETTPSVQENVPRDNSAKTVRHTKSLTTANSQTSASAPPCCDLTHLVSASWTEDQSTRGERHLWLKNNSGTSLVCAWEAPTTKTTLRGSDNWAAYQNKMTGLYIMLNWSVKGTSYSCIAQSQNQAAVEGQCKWNFAKH